MVDGWRGEGGTRSRRACMAPLTLDVDRGMEPANAAVIPWCDGSVHPSARRASELFDAPRAVVVSSLSSLHARCS